MQLLASDDSEDGAVFKVCQKLKMSGLLDTEIINKSEHPSGIQPAAVLTNTRSEATINKSLIL